MKAKQELKMYGKFLLVLIAMSCIIGLIESL